MSFELRPSEDGSEVQVHRLDFDEWKKRMVGGTDVQTDSKGLYDCMYVVLAMFITYLHTRWARNKYYN